MTALVFIAAVIAGRALLEACRENPAPYLNWFMVYPHLKESKKRRGRGEGTGRRTTRRAQ